MARDSLISIWDNLAEKYNLTTKHDYTTDQRNKCIFYADGKKVARVRQYRPPTLLDKNYIGFVKELAITVDYDDYWDFTPEHLKILEEEAERARYPLFHQSS